MTGAPSSVPAADTDRVLASLDPATHDMRSRLSGLLFWIVLPIAAVAFITAASLTFAHRVNAQPGGVRGTYVASLRSCQGSVCTVAGTFTSEDNSLIVRNVLGDYRWKVDQPHRVVLNPRAEIIALPARWNPTPTIVGAFGGVVFLLVWAGCLWGAVRRRRPDRLR